MGGDWQHLLQSIILGLIFSFLLAKLISFVTAFKEANLSISRSQNSVGHHRPLRKASSAPDTTNLEGNNRLRPVDSIGDMSDDYSVLAEKGSVVGGDLLMDDLISDDDDDDDWEGVESTELDEAFNAATAFVAATAADKMSYKVVSNDVQLQLYGLYKIATEGPCNGPPPPAYKIARRAKWNAWQKLGAMPPEDAMQKYVDIVTEMFPSWASGGADKTKNGGTGAHTFESKGRMGPVFSSFIHEEESGIELKMDAIHTFAREGDVDKLLKCTQSSISVDSKDSEGRTPFHWAVDRGHLSVVELLLSKNADVNAKDNEGQTPLHYAAVCDREAIAEYLVKHNADLHVKDHDDNTPMELCKKNWAFMQPENKVEQFSEKVE